MTELIRLQTQQENDTCVSACLGMLLGIDHQQIVKEFHDKYQNHETDAGEFLENAGLVPRYHYTRENLCDLLVDRVYLLVVPSRNIEGGHHQIVAHTLLSEDNQLVWRIYDPCEGREGKKYYTGTETQFSWVAELSVSVRELLSWRVLNESGE